MPRWIRWPVEVLAAAFVGPTILGIIGFIAAVLAPLGVVVLPFIVWGLTRSGTPEHAHAPSPSQERVRERRREPVLQPS